MKRLKKTSSKLPARLSWIKRNVRAEKILDVGFVGDIRPHLIIRKTNPDALVVGIDINKEKVKRFKHSLGEMSYIILASGLKLPFKENSFDAVFLGEIIEHVWQPLDLLNGAYWVLQKGGKLFLTTPNPLDLAKYLHYLFRGEYVLGCKNHKMLFDPVSLRNMLRHSNFKVLKLETLLLRISLPFLHRRWKMDIRIPLFNHIGFYTCVIAEKVDLSLRK